jgi:hypothetical protein
LTAVEYENTIRDVLGVELPTPAPGDATQHGFDNASETFTISDGIVEQYLALATAVAEGVDLAAVTGCDPAAAGEEGCLEALLDRVGLRTFRRPVTLEERDAYGSTFDEIRVEDGDDTALRAVLVRMLISPQFLYHVEIGRGDGRTVTPYEIASRLSYLLWESVPDEALFDAAEAEQLETPEQLAEQVDRMLADSRARRTLYRFHAQWLGFQNLHELIKSEEIHPAFDGIRTDLQTEMELLVADLFQTPDAGFAALLTADWTFANAAVAELYGVVGPGESFERIELDPEQRAGILTRAGFLAAQAGADRSSPINRGVAVLDRLMCNTLPPPPPDAGELPDELPATNTTRELIESLTAGASCATCHDLINPIGFTFEHYDAVGRWRDEENGFPIDSTATVLVDDAPVGMKDAIDLVHTLADSPWTERCYVRHWFRYGFQRSETPGDAALLGRLEAANEDGGGRLRDIPRVVATAPEFGLLHYRNEDEAGN